jgi:hypothetical protein
MVEGREVERTNNEKLVRANENGRSFEKSSEIAI